MNVMHRQFSQVDVFSSVPYRGNPVAVVLAADGISDDDMALFARWTSLSETTFVLPPLDPRADYRLRIFTQTREIPFAGHPTLGSAHAWLEAGGVPASGDVIVQECGAGLVDIRRQGTGLAFRAPALIRSGPLEPALVEEIAAGLRIDPEEIIGHQWVDNGPGWAAVQLASAADVLALDPDDALMADRMLGVVGAHPAGAPHQFELRSFALPVGVREDPVTGSLNAGVAQWLVGTGIAPASYSATQGSAVGRLGVITVDSTEDGIWVGGVSSTCIRGTVEL
jgi:PhzF family phenazine biosynthesis protein